jgi:hypothetical protein
MLTHCSILAWRIPRTEEPGRLQSMTLKKVRHDFMTKQQKENGRAMGGGKCMVLE